MNTNEFTNQAQLRAFLKTAKDDVAVYYLDEGKTEGFALRIVANPEVGRPNVYFHRFPRVLVMPDPLKEVFRNELGNPIFEDVGTKLKVAAYHRDHVFSPIPAEARENSLAAKDLAVRELERIEVVAPLPVTQKRASFSLSGLFGRTAKANADKQAVNQIDNTKDLRKNNIPRI